MPSAETTIEANGCHPRFSASVARSMLWRRNAKSAYVGSVAPGASTPARRNHSDSDFALMARFFAIM